VSAETSYAAALERLQGLSRFGVRLGLGSTRRLLSRLDLLAGQGGDPGYGMVIHLAGTNGKGSTAAMLEACLREAGLRTGLYTSPHLCRFSERIQVAGREIPRQEVPELAQRVLALDPGLTFFEVATAMALLHFARQRVQVAVVETGLGGRLDATNVLAPAVCVLTHIGLDHTEVLGDDLASVAGEKAGIIKPGVPVVSAADPAGVAGRVIAGRCRELDSPLWSLGRDFALREEGYAGPRWRLPRLPGGLAGAHQRQNAALCLAALELLQQRGLLQITTQQAARGLQRVRWPGRMERSGAWLLDGAHNPDGCRALAGALGPGDRGLCLVLGVLGPDRPLSQMLAPLRPWAGRVILTRPASERAADPAALARRVPGAEVAASLGQALDLARSHPGTRLITGSLYLVGEARALLLGEPTDPVRTADPLACISYRGVVARHGGPRPVKE
jgi:dihydrofolate synthase/folylpolyglutamate synthase